MPSAKNSTLVGHLLSRVGERRGGGEGGRNAQQLHSRAQSRDIKVWSSDEASAQHFIATYAIKRSKSFLNATYFLFWNIIFLLTVQCQSFATFVSISRSSPTTIINNSIRFKFHASIILSLIIRKEGGIEKEALSPSGCPMFESKTRKKIEIEC